MTERATLNLHYSEGLEAQLRALRDAPEFTMQVVTAQTGVPADTIRSWERRHGFPEPGRTSGNQRLYSERDIAAISWLNEHGGKGIPMAAAVDRLRSAMGPAEAIPADVHPVSSLGLALENHDMAAAQAAWDGLALGISTEALVRDVLYPLAMRMTTWPSAQAALAFLERKATVLFDATGADSGRPSCHVLRATGAVHPVFPLLLGTLLSRRGYAVPTPFPALDTTSAVAELTNLDPEAMLVFAGQPDDAIQRLIDAVRPDSSVAIWRIDQRPDASLLTTLLPERPT